MPDDKSKLSSFSNGRRWLNWLNAVLGAAGLLALVVMVNYLADGHSQRFQLDRNSLFKLTDQTRRVLDSLTNDVNITVFFDPHGPNEDIYSLTTSLLAEYKQACPRHINITNIDYGHEVGEAKEFLSKHNLAGLQEKDFILFECGGAQKPVYAKELATYDFSDRLAGRSLTVRRSAFLGELYFTENIYDVANPRPAKAYFLTGHGENDPEDNRNNYGYSKFAGLLKDELNCNWEKLSLQGTNDVPADCQLLVVAASARESRLLPDEVDKIRAYLKQGGRMMALLTEVTGLEPLMADWGVDIGPANNRVIDLDKSVSRNDSQSFLCKDLATNFITDPLISDNMPLLMVFPRAVGEMRNRSKLPGMPTVTVLAATTKEAMNEARQKSQFPLIAEVEQGGIQGVGGGTRMVIAGDSDFLDDQVIDFVGNHIFAKRALSWLLQRQETMLPGLGPRPIHEYRIYMTRGQAQSVRWLLLAGLPATVLFLGGLVWLRRRS